MFGRILNTPLPTIMITSDIKNFYKTSSQQTLLGLYLVLETILIFFSVHFILIQVNLPQEKIQKMLITQLPNKKIM